MTAGRVAAFSSMVIALLLARPFIGGFESGFQTVQEYTGFIAPGVVAVFLLGFFDRKTNAVGAFTALIGAAIVSRFTARPAEERTVKLGDIAFAISLLFNTLAMPVVAMLVGLYV